MNAVEMAARDSHTKMSSADSPDVQPIGASIAVAISLVITMGGLFVSEFGWIPGTVGLPIAAVLAWQMSRELVAAHGWHVLAIALWLAAKTILITAAFGIVALMTYVVVAGFGWVVDGHPAIQIPLYVITGAAALIVLAAMYYFIGLALLGLPALAIVVPAAIVWAVVVRLVVSRRADRGTLSSAPVAIGPAPR